MRDLNASMTSGVASVACHASRAIKRMSRVGIANLTPYVRLKLLANCNARLASDFLTLSERKA